MFVQGGGVNPGSSLNYTGHEGVYWSSVGRSSPDAYSLNFYSGGVIPSINVYRYSGYSIRCVALGS